MTTLAEKELRPKWPTAYWDDWLREPKQVHRIGSDRIPSQSLNLDCSTAQYSPLLCSTLLRLYCPFCHPSPISASTTTSFTVRLILPLSSPHPTYSITSHYFPSTSSTNHCSFTLSCYFSYSFFISFSFTIPSSIQEERSTIYSAGDMSNTSFRPARSQ